MGQVVVYDPPKQFMRIFRMVSPFMDEKTLHKVVFIQHGENNERLADLFGTDMQRRILKEIELSREQPDWEFWRERPEAPMEPLHPATL